MRPRRTRALFCLLLLAVFGKGLASAQTQEQKPKPKELPDAPSKGVPLAKPLPAAKLKGLGNVQIEVLTPIEEVDMSNYLSRMLVTVRRNWFAVVPESARQGEKGRVVVRFRILRDGRIPEADVKLETSSGKQPLDDAVMSSVRSSSPLEPLPAKFKGPQIEIRFIFLYNLPLSEASR